MSKNNSSGKGLLVILLFSGLVNAALASIIIYYNREGEKHKFFVSEAAAYQGIKENTDQEKILEMRVFVTRTLYNMFSYDQNNFVEKTDRGMKFMDKQSGNYIYNELIKSGIYDKMKSENSRVDIQIDSVLVKLKDEYPVKVYARQKLIYSDAMGVIPLAARMKIDKVKRCEENPEGQLIKNWEFIKYTVE